ncbi:sugar ABC transporter substrate-binding protein [Angustibacter speluncae]
MARALGARRLAGPAGLSRRHLLQLAGLGAVGGAVAGCSGFSTQGDDDADGAVGGALRFLTWAGDAEARGYQALADGFEQQTGTRVELEVVPYSEVLTAIDTGLSSGSPPDVFRVSYTDVGPYRAQDVLAELGGAADELQQALLPAFVPSVSDGSAVYGVPQHTDTSMVLVNLEAAQAAGLGELPTTLDGAWTWEQFQAAARSLAGVAAAGTYAFAVNWSEAGAYRWLNWVDQAGGRLLTEDLAASALADDAGARRALEFTRSFFADGLVPPDNTTNGTPASDLFTNGTVAMCFAGDFLLEGFEGLPFEYGATFLPRDERASADLGGNALVAVKDSPREEAAREFLLYCAQAEQMASFCATANVLPTRSDVDATSLEFPIRPDLMPLYVEQATTISAELVGQVVVPRFTAVNAALREGLETAFASTGDVGESLASLSDGVQQALDQ